MRYKVINKPIMWKTYILLCVNSAFITYTLIYPSAADSFLFVLVFGIAVALLLMSLYKLELLYSDLEYINKYEVNSIILQNGHILLNSEYEMLYITRMEVGREKLIDVCARTIYIDKQ